METLADLGIFFIGVGCLLAGVSFLWWCSMHAERSESKREDE